MSNPFQSAAESEILSKLYRYCSYQERCENDVKKKMKEWGFSNDEMVEEWVGKLKELELIDDRRFSKLFAIGRFRIKRWGRIKIRYALNQKGISDQDILSGLDCIPQEEYLETIVNLIHQKNRLVRTPDLYQRRHKISKYMISKGYEPEFVWKLLRDEVR